MDNILADFRPGRGTWLSSIVSRIRGPDPLVQSVPLEQGDSPTIPLKDNSSITRAIWDVKFDRVG